MSQPAPFMNFCISCTNENREIERKRIAIVDVGQNRKRLCRGIRFQRRGKVLQVGRDRDDLAADRFDVALRLGQSICIDPTIGAPVPSVERQRHRPLGKQFFKADEMPLIVRQHEGRHGITNSRGRGTGTVEVQPRNKPVHRFGKRETRHANGVREGFEPCTEWRIQVTRALECLFENFGKRQFFHAMSSSGRRANPPASILVSKIIRLL